MLGTVGVRAGRAAWGVRGGGQTRGRNGAFMLRTHTHRSEPLCSLGAVAMPRHLCVRLTTRSPPHRLRLTPGRRAENTDSTVTCRNSTSVPQRDQLRCEHSMLPPVCLRALISISTLVAHHLDISAPIDPIPAASSARAHPRAHPCATKRDVRLRVFTCTQSSRHAPTGMRHHDKRAAAAAAAALEEVDKRASPNAVAAAADRADAVAALPSPVT